MFLKLGGRVKQRQRKNQLNLGADLDGGNNHWDAVTLTIGDRASALHSWYAGIRKLDVPFKYPNQKI